MADADNRRWANLPHQLGETIEYVRTETASMEQPPILYVPGFTEGLSAKAPFVAELTQQGFPVILPDQNWESIVKDSLTNKRGATYTQALNYLSILNAEGLLEQEHSVNVVSHSYGSLVFDAMARLARAQELPCFNKSTVIMLSPAGFNEKESLLRLGARFAKMNLSEMKTPKDFPDETGEQFKAGLKNFTANIPRGIRECFELTKLRVDYNAICSQVGQLAIVSYAEDVLYSGEHIRPGITKAMEAGATWSVPVSLDDFEGQLRSGKHATHNDEQFNPSRVAGAISRILA